MSRIDEALRRAADGVDGTPAPALPRPHAAATSQDVAILENEPYPDEVDLGPGDLRLPAGDPVDTESESDPDATPRRRATNRSAHRTPDSGSVFDRIESRLSEKTVVDGNMSAIAREQYRRVAAVLHDAQGTTGLRTIMVASAVPGEGKTLTAANLALTLSESYHRRVLLIDADLRKPTLHQIFQISSVIGLTTGLDPTKPSKLIVHQMSPRLSVLPAGRPTTDPMAGLTSSRMRRLLDEAKASFDWVIIDTPPVMLLPDAHLLASMVDGAVLVIRAHSTPHDASRRAAEALGRTRIVGVVLNQADPASAGSKNSYYYSYYTRNTPPGKDLTRT